jgi:hypothetical protein
MATKERAIAVVQQYIDGAITIEELINWIVVNFPAGLGDVNLPALD